MPAIDFGRRSTGRGLDPFCASVDGGQERTNPVEQIEKGQAKGSPPLLGALIAAAGNRSAVVRFIPARPARASCAPEALRRKEARLFFRRCVPAATSRV